MAFLLLHLYICNIVDVLLISFSFKIMSTVEVLLPVYMSYAFEMLCNFTYLLFLIGIPLLQLLYICTTF